MMRFFKDFDHPSQLFFRYGAVATLSMAGLLLTSSSASGFQANSSQTDAAQDRASTQQANVQGPKAEPKKLPESRIAELRAFAKAHHPEIMPLLDSLEKKRPKKFQKVMTGLDRNVSNLERMQKRSPEAYQRGLANWINQSRIQLYAAQFKVAADDKTAADLRVKIRLLIEENLDARVSHFENELVSAKDRVLRLQNAADDIKANRDALIEKKFAAATKNAPRMSRGLKKPAKPTDKAGSKETDKGTARC